MRTLTAREAGRYVGRLSSIAKTLEANYEGLGLSQKQALDFAFEVDSICDEIERTSIATAQKQAKLLQGDPQDPEKYMADNFGDSPGYIEGQKTNPDETYMQTFEYQGGGVHPTQGSGSVVTERTESPIQELSQYSDGFKKQPSQPYVGGSPHAEVGRKASTGARYVRQAPKRS